MRLVDKATVKPSRCAVLPFIGMDHVDGFVDTGSEMPGLGDQWDFHIYCSVVAVRQMATLIGWTGPDENEAVLQQLAELQLELDQAREDLEKAELVLDSIDALESADFRARKKSGRPPKREPEPETEQRIEPKRGMFKKRPDPIEPDPEPVEEMV